MFKEFKFNNIRNILSVIFLMIFIFSSCGKSDENLSYSAIDLKPIKLPAPQMSGGKPLMQALKERKSERSLIEKKLPEQIMSNLLWAAFGINRPDGKRTAPSAVDWQEIDVYTVMKDGVYIYDAKELMLIPVLKGDIRAETGSMMQPFVKNAPLNLVYVLDASKIGTAGRLMSDEDKLICSAVSTGCISQNIYLYCASEGLGTVVRMMVDKENLAKIMKLKSTQKIILTQTVGYPE